MISVVPTFLQVHLTSINQPQQYHLQNIRILAQVTRKFTIKFANTLHYNFFYSRKESSSVQ